MPLKRNDALSASSFYMSIRFKVNRGMKAESINKTTDFVGTPRPTRGRPSRVRAQTPGIQGDPVSSAAPSLTIGVCS